MGANQSYISSEAAVAVGILAAGAVAYGMNKDGSETQSSSTQEKNLPEKRGADKSSNAGSKNGKKKASGQQPSAPNVALSHSTSGVPGGFDSASVADGTPDGVAVPETGTTTKPKKANKKKGKSPAVDVQSESSSAEKVAAPPSSSSNKGKRQAAGSGLKSPALSSMSIETDGSWTRVDSRKKGNRGGEATSDAGVTGNSSPTTERTEDEAPVINPSKQKTFAEKMLPKPRRTGVNDMLEESDFPSVSRVMRVTPNPDEKPAKGFTWGDYEDVNDSNASAAGGTDADREDDGWGVVRRGKPKTDRVPSQQPQGPAKVEPKELTKKQRQNAKKREEAKAAKADAETERLAGLAKHKRELEKARVAELSKSKIGKATSGGMSAAVDSNGRLIWE
jgi:hypothetical protein